MKLRANGWRVVFVLVLLTAASGWREATSQPPTTAQGITRLCVIQFNEDSHLPARVENSAAPCLSLAKDSLAADRSLDLYLVATADKVKDNKAGHGRTRTEQDMTGGDLRYADIAAYRAINTKAYLVRWLSIDPSRIVPLTAYEDGQWVAFYAVKSGVPFKQSFGKPTAPILSQPCTVKPCATGPEEFLIPQQRERIPPSSEKTSSGDA